MGIPVFVLKDTMPYSEYRERGAYYAIQEQNDSQTDINIARLSMDYRNVNYKEKISIKETLGIEPVSTTDKQVSLNVGQWHSMVKNGVKK